MLVAMDYTQDGARTISFLNYNANYNEDEFKTAAHILAHSHDEIYAVDFDPNSQDFINEIVTNGCRI